MENFNPIVKMLYNDPNIDSFKLITNVNHAPLDSFLIYNMEGGLGYVSREDYAAFCQYYIKGTTFKKHHTMDLAFAKYHNLILDIDFKGQFTCNEKSIFLDSYLKPTLKSFFDELSCFTCIIATRINGGIHVHMPEFLISNDDYIQLCTQLQRQINVTYPNYTVEVDIPTCFCLATASKPNVEAYTPFNICFFEQNSEISLPLSDRPGYLREYKRMKFKNKKSNSNSLFRKLIYYQYDQIIAEVLNCMFPYVVCPGIQMQHITYQTIFSENPVNDYQPIGNLYYNNSTCYIYKSHNLNFKSLDWLSVYNFLNNRCFKIIKIETENYAIKYWFSKIQSSINTHCDIFQNINKMIKDDNYYWRNEPHPLREIMKYDNGFYFLPVFYALCKIIDKPPHEILDFFTGSSLDELIRRLKLINEKLFIDTSQNFTIGTILYCAAMIPMHSANSYEKLTIEQRVDMILEQTKGSIFHCISALDYEEVIQNIIMRYTPIVIGLYKYSSKKSTKLVWNLITEHWQESMTEEIKMHVQLFHKRMQVFLEKNKKDSNIFNKIQISEIANFLQGKANMQRLELQMDSHKFLLKTRVGILDLLTGHVSGIVPEFFMSNKCIDVHFTKVEMNHFRQDPEIISICKTITSKPFFRTFLKYSLTDVSDDFLDIIKIVSNEFKISSEYKYLDSILNFYCHLCKYMCFEYDMVIFMLNIISSIFIATNYYRRFFVFQGNTKNGKSKFFEFFSRVFGSYSHAIRSINLQVAGNSAGPQPEFAGTLHSCRFITIEEINSNSKLNENFIKLLTGNNQISCRNLYEANAGGIPTAKVVCSTNNPPQCVASDAFRERVLVIPFNASFSNDPPVLISDQIDKNIYKIDLSDDVVRNSYEGMFILAYCNLGENIDYETGLLNLPNTPDKIVEFKDDYLQTTDIYVLFKQYVDLQIISKTKLLYVDLVSAVRKFLINTKNQVSLETPILKRFDEEFASHKKEVNSGIEHLFKASASDDCGDEPEEISKKRKITVIYYQNICIKEFKKKGES